MPRRIVLSLAVAIAALLLGLVLAFLSRGSPPQPQPEQCAQPGRRSGPCAHQPPPAAAEVHEL